MSDLRTVRGVLDWIEIDMPTVWFFVPGSRTALKLLLGEEESE